MKDAATVCRAIRADSHLLEIRGGIHNRWVVRNRRVCQPIRPRRYRWPRPQVHERWPTGLDPEDALHGFGTFVGDHPGEETAVGVDDEEGRGDMGEEVACRDCDGFFGGGVVNGDLDYGGVPGIERRIAPETGLQSPRNIG